MQESSSTEDVMRELQSLFMHMFSREVIESDSFMQSCMSSAMTIPLQVVVEVRWSFIELDKMLNKICCIQFIFYFSFTYTVTKSVKYHN